MTRDEEIEYKRLYAHALRPFMEFIKYHREESTTGSWIEITEKLFSRAITNPEQYLGKDLPSPNVINKIVTEIFNDFKEECEF
jgi:hypothetical protein